jgi:hypothetical protein
MTNIIAKAAQQMLKHGWHCIPLQSKDKKPIEAKWQKRLIKADEIDRVFTADRNIGLLLGEPSGGVVDIDCDTPEAVTVASLLMPDTGLSFGRETIGRAFCKSSSPALCSKRERYLITLPTR